VFTTDRRHIVQEYISSPLLLDTLKFDLRVYVVVTSTDPLEVILTHAVFTSSSDKGAAVT